MRRQSRCSNLAHVWDHDAVPDPASLEGLLVDDARCQCGRYAWAEMNARLRETEMLERMASDG